MEIDSTKLKILQLKEEVFELIKRQEMLTIENNQIQEAKFKKVQEIQALEGLHVDNPVVGLMR